MTQFHYVGNELDLFAAATNWKAYWSARISRYIHGDVLEVGAGIGSNTALLRARTAGTWLCLEPDPNLVAELRQRVSGLPNCEAVCGTVASLPQTAGFDTIIYIDVLEHIEHDSEELKQAAARLRPGARIVVLSPAHQFLFSPFDAAIGHFRRYTKSSLRAASPPGLTLEALFYLDSVGIIASAANHLFLKQSMPTAAQIKLWDTRIIPVSRTIDPLLAGTLGKSVVGVWRKPQE